MSGSRADPPPLPARLADRYALEKPLASGGSAEVWQGIDRVLKRPVAVKVLHRHLLTDPTTRARLTQEAQAAASLSHPGIVSVYDVAVSRDGAAIVLELVDGRALANKLKDDGILPPRAAARIGAEVAEALEHAHQRGVIHRDVKAANVLIGPDGEARLVDFGIARILDDEAMQLTAPGTITGTLRSMAPEQLRGEPTGPATDVYATGVLLTEMLTGEPPYAVATPVELAAADQIPPLVIGDAPHELATIVRRALDPDPASRQPSAGSLALELHAWLESDASPAAGSVPDAMTEPAMAIPAFLAAEPVTPEPAAPAVAAAPGDDEKRPGWLAAAILVVGLVVVLVLVLAARPPLAAGPEGAPSSASVAPSVPVTPAPTPVPTPTPPPAPATLDDAIAQFGQAVAAAQQSGTLEDDAAEDLVELADRFLEDDLNGGDVNRIGRDLQRAIDRFEEDGEISSPEVADDLRRRADDLEALARA
jgi:serine/threonine-protein kinase